MFEDGGPATVVAVHLACKLGNVVFSLIGQDALLRWIPFSDVRFIHAGSRILVSFRSLLRQWSKWGTIYYSRHEPKLVIDGQPKIVGFHRHAIERICERIVPHWRTYAGLGDAYAFFDQCMHFEQANLLDKQKAFTFYDMCAKGFFQEAYIKNVLGDNVVNDDHYYYRVGYCPYQVEDEFVVAKTLLVPGQQPTPESKLIWSSDLPVEKKAAAYNWTTDTLYETADFRLLKHFHDKGVAQVIHSEKKFYKPF